MLKVQEYLKSGKTLDTLKDELGISAVHHPELPLVILNYSQIDSPKCNLLVRECRGLVLNKQDWSIAAKSMNRFFNWGEVADEMDYFDWSTCTTQEKADGSLCVIYYFDGKWHANTRGSFAYGPMLNHQWQAKYFGLPDTFTWHDGFLRALSVDSLETLNLDKSLTYICEFCSLWNKVVRNYPNPCMYLITCFVGEEEVGPQPNPMFRNLEQYAFNTVADIERFVNVHPESSFEGCVVKDASYRRWKLKNDRYIALSRLKGNNSEWNPKYLLPFVLSGEESELLTYFPEVEPLYLECKSKVDKAFGELNALWNATKDIENQKKFALSIVGKTPFTGVLFTTRKTGGVLKDEWRKSEDLILKILLK